MTDSTLSAGKFRTLVVKGLNAGVLADWVAVLAVAASGAPYKHCYDESAFLRSKAVGIQINEYLQRLSPFKFNIHA